MKNTRDRQKAINQIIQMADVAISIGEQLTALATRLKSDALSARDESGVSNRQTRKGNKVLTSKQLLKLEARLTK
jgi:4-hydroxy-3-methylbut-2-enyl diphosphate reductase IspH